MRVILRENIENLGQIGDIVRVSPGYARNFLFPRGLVYPADESRVREIEHHRRVLAKKREAQKAAAKEVATKLGEFSCKIQRRVGKNDKLFGSVSAHDIYELVKEAGFTISKSAVRLGKPIKSLGKHEVEIALENDVSATITVEVAAED